MVLYDGEAELTFEVTAKGEDAGQIAKIAFEVPEEAVQEIRSLSMDLVGRCGKGEKCVSGSGWQRGPLTDYGFGWMAWGILLAGKHLGLS